MTRARQLKWAAQVDHVREATLAGTADAGAWSAYFESIAPGVSPVAQDGRCPVMIVAAEARFYGVQFREVSISVSVSSQSLRAGQLGETWFLAQAWSSVRAFAWVERTMFSTPYEHALISLDPLPPVKITLASATGAELRATMAPQTSTARSAKSDADEEWLGYLLVPNRVGASAQRQQAFIARLRGRTQRFAFDPQQDELRISAGTSTWARSPFADCDFVADEWVIRGDGFHAKSRTYRLTEIEQMTVSP